MAKNKNETTTVLLPADLKAKAKQFAKKERRSLSSLIIIALEEFLNKQSAK